MAHAFYPFVENEGDQQETEDGKAEVRYPARIAVYDDLSSAPRVVVIEPQDVRSYLEEITEAVTRLSKEQGGTIPFTVIREIVENYIHAYFIEPTISILDGGNTIRFADQGPGIEDKERAMEFGTTSATREMKRYIRGTGAGLPLVQEYMESHDGTLKVEDNISSGTIVTISTRHQIADDGPEDASLGAGAGQQAGVAQAQDVPAAIPQQPAAYQQAYPYQQPAAYQAAPAYVPVQPQQPAQWYQPLPQQAAGQMAPAQQQMAYQQHIQPQQPAYLAISERGEAILSYLTQHESVGPTELKALYGSSAPTWTRELQTLEAAGLIMKRGQKRVLTDAGRQFLAARGRA